MNNDRRQHHRNEERRQYQLDDRALGQTRRRDTLPRHVAAVIGEEEVEVTDLH